MPRLIYSYWLRTPTCLRVGNLLNSSVSTHSVGFFSNYSSLPSWIIKQPKVHVKPRGLNNPSCAFQSRSLLSSWPQAPHSLPLSTGLPLSCPILPLPSLTFLNRKPNAGCLWRGYHHHQQQQQPFYRMVIDLS